MIGDGDGIFLVVDCTGGDDDCCGNGGGEDCRGDDDFGGGGVGEDVDGSGEILSDAFEQKTFTTAPECINMRRELLVIYSICTKTKYIVYNRRP